MPQIAKAYFYLFYRSSGWARHVSKDGLHDWKAILAITTLQILLVMGSVYGYENVARKNLFSREPVDPMLGVVFFFCFVNYWLFVHDNRGHAFDREIDAYSPKTHGLLAMVIVLLAA